MNRAKGKIRGHVIKPLFVQDGEVSFVLSNQTLTRYRGDLHMAKGFDLQEGDSVVVYSDERTVPRVVVNLTRGCVAYDEGTMCDMAVQHERERE